MIYTASQTARLVADWQKEESARQSLQESLLYNQTADRLRMGRRDEQVIIHQLAAQTGPSLSKQDIYEGVGRALSERPEEVTILDEIGYRRGQRRGNGIHEYLEKRHRH